MTIGNGRSSVIKFCKKDPRAIAPIRATEGSAGYDIYLNDSIALKANQTVVINSGLQFEIPENYVGLLRLRSSVGKMNIVLLTSVIDSDFRGEVFYVLRNLSDENMIFKSGTRLVQLLFIPVLNNLKESKELSETKRNKSGSGSTGF